MKIFLISLCLSIVAFITILQLDFSYRLPKEDANIKLTQEEMRTAIIPYLDEMNKINEKYGTSFHLEDENIEEFYNYIKDQNQSVKEFRKEYLGYTEELKKMNLDF